MANAYTRTGGTHGTAAVLEVVEVQRKVLRDELKTLDTIAAKLGGEVEEAVAQLSSAPRPKSRKGIKTNSPAAAKRRQLQVYEYLVAIGGEVAPKAIRDALGLNENQVRKATQRLAEAGKVRKKGERQHTRYEVITDAPSTTPTASVPGTLSGRALTEMQERGFVTPAELTELTGEGEETIRKVCGQLIREEEIRWERRGERRGYVAVGGA